MTVVAHDPGYYRLTLPTFREGVRATGRHAPCCAAYLAQAPWPAQVDLLFDHPGKYFRAVATCARYFRREFGYDVTGFSAREAYHLDSSRAFFWYASSVRTTIILGACCFRWRTYTNCGPFWALQWIWLHPYARGKGLLTAAWPMLSALHAPFDVEGPLSPAMRAFLATKPVSNGTMQDGKPLRLYTVFTPPAAG
jgi:hypothetical protein